MSPPAHILLLPDGANVAAGLVAANGTSDDPAAYSNAVAQHLLPDVLPYRHEGRFQLCRAERSLARRQCSRGDVLPGRELGATYRSHTRPIRGHAKQPVPYLVAKPATEE